MLGGDRAHSMMIERITKIAEEPWTAKERTIYRMDSTRAFDSKHSKLKLMAPSKDLKLLHYWGNRLDNMTKKHPESRHVLEKTEPLEDVKINVASRIRASMVAYGDHDAFSNITGP